MAHRCEWRSVGDIGCGEAGVVGALHQLSQQERHRPQQLIWRPRYLHHPVRKPQRLLFLRHVQPF